MPLSSRKNNTLAELGSKLEGASVYSLGQGESSLRTQKWPTRNHIISGTLAAWNYISASCGITGSKNGHPFVVISSSLGGGAWYAERASWPMLHKGFCSDQMFNACTREKSVCVFQTKSGSAVFLPDGKIVQFSTSSAQTPKEQIVDQFREVIDYNIAEVIARQSIGSLNASNLRASVTSSGNIIHALVTGSLGG